MNKPNRNSSTSVLKKLNQLIVQKGLLPGDRLPSERELAIELDACRETIRAAMRSLAFNGIIAKRQGAGNFLAEVPTTQIIEPNPLRSFIEINGISIEELFEARVSLEMASAELAAEKAEGEDLIGIAEELAEMCANLDLPIDYLDHDMRFH